ncbi:unnamed protein product [Agarophyton chilense]|eukprot:gb/GEZJ01003583.1/.p1 GENE.gb/GEZJ01003583.1/~~gb/GEZJ01003583.1/.p1  ORF type:complete len:306 (-),score=63.17 gb/GEZJ01003583.1/:114-1031(-)
MDPLSGLRKEIEKKRKSRSQETIEKWKSKFELEEEYVKCPSSHSPDEPPKSETITKRRKISIPGKEKDDFVLKQEDVSTIFPNEIAKTSDERNPGTGHRTHFTEEKAVLDNPARIDNSQTVQQTAVEEEVLDQDMKLAKNEILPLQSIPNDKDLPKKDYVIKNINSLMSAWEAEISDLEADGKTKGKRKTMQKMYEQTKKWLRPLKKLLRKQKLERIILNALEDIFEAIESKNYTRANSLYLERLAIGNAPWPMGATMVGIHARAAREKIGEDKIAHVMNDEQTRKYIQAVKRLITVAERNIPAL